MRGRNRRIAGLSLQHISMIKWGYGEEEKRKKRAKSGSFVGFCGFYSGEGSVGTGGRCGNWYGGGGAGEFADK